MTLSPPPLLQASEIRKQFPGVLALDNVSMHLREGEVLAIVGENGAGKSTLMKILAGIYQPDSGAIRLDGRYVRFNSVNDAMDAGISLIHQELNLAENLSVAASIFLGREKLGGRFFLKRSAMRREALKLMERVGLPADLVNVPVEHLTPGHKQLVEIARALGMNARVLIMDEPTSSLTQGETDKLYDCIRELLAAGVGIIYISHRLAEVDRVADRITVLRDGKNVGELHRGSVGHDEMIRAMVGRDLKNLYPREHRRRDPAQNAALEVRNLRYRGGPATPVSFSIHPGEIVGMAGLVGAGRTELAEAIFGIRHVESGEVLLNGQPIRTRSPGEAIGQGILLVPEDRRLNGLILEEGVGFNLSLPNLDQLQWKLYLVALKRERELAASLVEKLKIKTPRLGQPAELLSGGNQQKVVIGKWLGRQPKVLILDEPTRGVDVGARSEIYGIIDQLAASGVAVWMISSDMEEILGMSDRVLVLHEGKLAGELSRIELNEEAIMRLATGTESRRQEPRVREEQLVRREV